MDHRRGSGTYQTHCELDLSWNSMDPNLCKPLVIGDHSDILPLLGLVSLKTCSGPMPNNLLEIQFLPLFSMQVTVVKGQQCVWGSLGGVQMNLYVSNLCWDTRSSVTVSWQSSNLEGLYTALYQCPPVISPMDMPSLEGPQVSGACWMLQIVCETILTVQWERCSR